MNIVILVNLVNLVKLVILVNLVNPGILANLEPLASHVWRARLHHLHQLLTGPSR